MATTYLSLHYHLVFATKNREALIAPPWCSRLHEYLGGIILGLGGFPQGVGGVADHVHLLVGLKATHCLADIMRELKKASSAWVHEEIGCRTFGWQEGYAAFTASAPTRPAVQQYIAHQDEHLRERSSRDELLDMLAKAEIEYDPRYFEYSNGGASWRCDPLRGRWVVTIMNRWCRCAQPPANCCNPSGVKKGLSVTVGRAYGRRCDSTEVDG
jgi:putative transposase